MYLYRVISHIKKYAAVQIADFISFHTPRSDRSKIE